LGLPTRTFPRHLAERILTSKAALEGERKQVTVLFADLKGSMELLLADRDPEEARTLFDPVRGGARDASVPQNDRRMGSSRRSRCAGRGRSEDIANARVFLASDASTYVTGDTIRVMGGRVIG
jgi:NAD(P)-dependent dehydrogenase (short-subunit alcohol dehydrogenase family)